jgi:TolB protein
MHTSIWAHHSPTKNNGMQLMATLPFLLLASTNFAQQPFGIFDAATDVGAVQHKGSTAYDAASQSYTLSGAGANIWFKQDEFHFAHKKLSGNFILSCRGKLLGKGTDPHRKLGWMLRTGLEGDAAMVCATVHGDGLTAIQFRKHKGDDVAEVKSPVKMPDVIQLERRGRSFFLSVAKFGEPFWTVEVPDFDLPADLVGGLFVCSHNKDVVERASFDNVRIVLPPKDGFTPYQDYLGSHVEVLDLVSGERKIVHSATNSIQAPNWTPDDKALIYNSDGLIYRFDLATGKPNVLNTDFVKQNNNDHVISFDGKMLGLSSSSGEQEYGSLVYTVPMGGGVPKRITATGPSYLHGWSPDGKWLTYTALRNGDYNIYKIPSEGGEEIQLTKAPGLDDGSEYSPDGQWIYFNSVRTGSMELWRMRPDGSYQEQLTDDEYQNWFPHVSPDGKWLVFLSYMPEMKADDHPFYQHVYLRMMPANPDYITGKKARVVAYLYGGQGTINTPSWSPDGKRVAFVSNTGM